MGQAFVLTLLLCISLSGQRLSLGILGGTAPTDAFQDLTLIPPQPYAVFSRHAFTPKKDLLAGASLEVQLNRRLSIEVDGIFRQLHLKQVIRSTDGSTDTGNIPVVTWEFPVLAKYRLPMRRATPFVEGGPIFRTIGNLNDTSPSQWGATAGAGLDLHWRSFKISPTVRYTRWRRDDPRYFPTLTVPNQLEILLGFSTEPASPWRPLGRRASIGVILGTNLTGDRVYTSRTQTISVSPPVNPPPSLTIIDQSGPRSLIVGPSIEFDLHGPLSLEADALYRKITGRELYRSDAAPRFIGPSLTDRTFIWRTWEFPIFLKYRFAIGRTHPFIGAGPSFRRPQSLTTPSPYGAVAAAGIEAHFHRLGIAPSVRFTRWGRDNSPEPTVRRNQSELLVRFSFQGAPAA